MLIKGGYYIKARCIQESDIATMPPHVREIWDWLIAAMIFDKNPKHKTLKRGQSLLSIRDIQEGLKWYVGFRKEMYTKSQCEMALNWLRKKVMITTVKTTRGMVVTVCNYELYQDFKNYEKNTESDTSGTRDEQSQDRIEKEDKSNLKEEKKESIPYAETQKRSAAQEKVDEFGPRFETHVNGKPKKEKKGSGQKKETEPLHTPCKIMYMEKYPEHFWEGKDAKALNLLLKKIRHSIKATGREPEDGEVKKAYRLILQHPVKWMADNHKLGLIDYASQYESIVNQYKNGTSGKAKSNGQHQYTEHGFREAVSQVFGAKP